MEVTCNLCWSSLCGIRSEYQNFSYHWWVLWKSIVKGHTNISLFFNPYNLSFRNPIYLNYEFTISEYLEILAILLQQNKPTPPFLKSHSYRNKSNTPVTIFISVYSNEDNPHIHKPQRPWTLQIKTKSWFFFANSSTPLQCLRSCPKKTQREFAISKKVGVAV